MKCLRTIAGRWLPPFFRRRLRRWYYPWLVRHLSPEQWRPARAIRALLAEGDIAVDVGANIGYTTYWLSQWVGAAGEVHSFEPVSETFCWLADNMRKLRRQNVRLYRAAVSDHEGVAEIEVPHWSDGRGENLYEARLVWESNAPPEQAIGDRREVLRESVPVVTLDSVFRHMNQPIVLVKVDVEGHEEKVLQGAFEILQRWKPALVMEVGEATAGAVFDQLSNLGYDAWVPESSFLRKVPGATPAADILFLLSCHAARLNERGVAMAG